MRRSFQISRIKSSLAVDWSLDVAQVELLRAEYGSNNIIETHKNRWVELIIDTAKDPMIWFLIATSLLFGFLKYYNQAIILFLATIPLIGIDAFLHWRTQVSTQGLRSKLATNATVIRKGIETTIPAWQIVPGDLVVVTPGMFFPADGIIVSGNNLQVDESALTGESFPVSKKPMTYISKEILEPIVDGEHWGFAGTRLLTGSSLLRVTHTGCETLYGEIISSASQTAQEHTPLQKAISNFIFAIIIAAIIFCLILAAVRYYQGFGLVDAILSAATLAIAALPDEFPVVFTFFLGVGVYRLARKKALVRRAVSVENIGRITCICSDKTGTITEGRFQLTRYLCAEKIKNTDLLYIAALASRLESGDPLDFAIYEAAKKDNIKFNRTIITFPFTEDRKRETSIAEYDINNWIVATKGAPEVILYHSKLSDIEKKLWLEHITELASLGYKVIACAKQFVQKQSHLYEPNINYQFAGLLAFEDPPRQGVIEAVQTCKKSNIHVLIVTGDHPETAKSIARQIGLGCENPKVIIADDMQYYSKKNNKDYLRAIDVIARAIPSQKYEIVTALKAAGEIVAVTGDGVNDVPALKAADIAVAMGERGTQSAREVADIILLDDNFDSIVNAIAEGRQLFKNLQLSFKYLLMIHMPFVFSAAIIPLLGGPLLYFPIHIAMIELIIHPTAILVFQDLPSSKKLEPAVLQKSIKFFTRQDWVTIIILGIFSTFSIIFGFIWALHINMNVEHARSLSLAFLFFTSATLTIGLTGFKTWTSCIVIFATFAFSILLIQIPIISKFLYFTPLNASDWLIVIIGSLIILGILKIDYLFKTYNHT